MPTDETVTCRTLLGYRMVFVRISTASTVAALLLFHLTGAGAESPHIPTQGRRQRRRYLSGGRRGEAALLASNRPHHFITPEFAISDDFLKALVPGEQIERDKEPPADGDGEEGISDEEEIRLLDGMDASWKDSFFKSMRPAVPEATSEEASSPAKDDTTTTEVPSTSSELESQPQSTDAGTNQTSLNPIRTRKIVKLSSANATKPALEGTSTHATDKRSRMASFASAITAVIREVRPIFRFSGAKPSTVKIQVSSDESGTPSQVGSQSADWRQSSLWREFYETQFTSSRTHIDDNLAEAVVDPKSLFFVTGAVAKAVTSLSLAFSGTLMLLPPMIFARRVLAYLAYGMSDWYTGRYLRTTYRQLESQYWRYYQIPATLRSVARSLILWMTMWTIGHSLEVLLYDLCSVESGGCKVWCAMIWIAAVVGVGEIFGRYIGKCETPLMIQISPCEKRERRVPPHRQFFRPRFLLKLLRDPDSLIRDIASKEDALRPFDPNPLLFPSTWQFFRFLQMIAVAKEMAVSSDAMHSMMRQVLIQEVLREEWYRVLMLEKRVALGIAVVTLYGLSTLALFFTVGEVSGPSVIFILPSLLGALVSGWMNVFVYFERRAKNSTRKSDNKGVNDRVHRRNVKRIE